MKSMFESAETLEAFARIDFNYDLLTQNLSLLNSMEIEMQSPIQIAIDSATGFTRKKLELIVVFCITVAENIVRDKKLIEMDTANTEATLEKLKAKYKQHFANENTKKGSQKAN